MPKFPSPETGAWRSRRYIFRRAASRSVVKRLRHNEQRRQKKGMPCVTYHVLPACIFRRTPAPNKNGDCSYPSSLCLPRRIIPGEDNEESLTKSESASRQAVFLLPCAAVSNNFF